MPMPDADIPRTDTYIHHNSQSASYHTLPTGRCHKTNVNIAAMENPQPPLNEGPGNAGNTASASTLLIKSTKLTIKLIPVAVEIAPIMKTPAIFLIFATVLWDFYEHCLIPYG